MSKLYTKKLTMKKGRMKRRAANVYVKALLIIKKVSSISYSAPGSVSVSNVDMFSVVDEFELKS